MLTWIESNAGTVIEVSALVIGYFSLRYNQKKDAVEVAWRVQERHDENIAKMARIETRVQHLDDCLDALKKWMMSARD